LPLPLINIVYQKLGKDVKIILSTYLKESREVFVIKGKGYLKIVTKKKVDLTRFFDTADLGMNIEDWDEFERRFYELWDFLMRMCSSQ